MDHNVGKKVLNVDETKDELKQMSRHRSMSTFQKEKNMKRVTSIDNGSRINQVMFMETVMILTCEVV